MDAIVFGACVFAIPSIIALLALRYGADSRPSYRSSEHVFALHNMRWEDRPSLTTRQEDGPSLAMRWEERPSHTPGVSQASTVRLSSVAGTTAYPTLALIDRTRRSRAIPFATDPNAARLEARARQLTDDYWPSSVWLTGFISPALLDTIVSSLEAAREEMRDSVRLLVATETPAQVGVMSA